MTLLDFKFCNVLNLTKKSKMHAIEKQEHRVHSEK